MLTQWLKNCLCEFHHIFNFSAGDKEELIVLRTKDQKLKVTDNISRKYSFRRRRTDGGFAVEHRLVKTSFTLAIFTMKAIT